MAGEDESRIVGRLDGTTRVVIAASGLLNQIAGFLRQLVSVIGWLALVVGAISSLTHPRLSLAHLLVPGTGALAVLQSAIKPRRKHPVHGSPSLADVDRSVRDAAHLTNAAAAPNAPSAPTCPPRQKKVVAARKG